MVDQDDSSGAERRDLAAELRADRAARPGDEDGRPGDVGRDRRHVELDGLAPEDVLHLHLADLDGEIEVAGDQLVDAGHRLHGHAGVPARVDDSLADLARTGRDGDDHLVGAVVLQQPREVHRRSQHSDPVEPHVLLAGLVVDQPDRRVAELRALEHLADDHLAGVARADDQRRLAAADDAAPRSFHQRPCEDARADDEAEREHPVDGDDPARQVPAGDRIPEVDEADGGSRGDGDGEHRPPHVPDGDVAPPVVVEAEEDEDDKLDRDDGDEDVEPEELVVTRRHALVEADLERQIPGERDEARVGGHLHSLWRLTSLTRSPPRRPPSGSWPRPAPVAPP